MASERDITSFAFFRAPGNADQNIPSIYPDGFVPEINNIADDRSLVAGLRGDTAGWAWDLSYNYGFNHLDFFTRNSLNASLGPDSPTSFFAGALETTQNIVNFDVSRQFDWGLAYPVNLAFGTEFREEKWNQSPGEPDSWRQGPLPPPVRSGAQGFPGYRPSDAGHYSRHNQALYADLEADLTDRLSGGAAVRYEDYSDFGGQTSGKLSGRYEFSETVALRGTVASGFRAPSLSQQNFQTTSTTFIAGISEPFEIRTFPTTSAIAEALGAEPLQPEESLSYSLGLVLQPVDRLYVTVDAYQVDVDDRIVLSSNLTGDDVRAFLEARGIFGVTGGRYFTNAIDTRTRGIDVVGSYRWELDAGTLDLTAGYNYSETEITRIAPNPTELETGGLDLERLDPAGRHHPRWQLPDHTKQLGQRPDLRRQMAGRPGRDVPPRSLELHPGWRQRARRISRGEPPRELGQRPVSRQLGLAFRLQWRLHVRQGGLPLVSGNPGVARRCGRATVFMPFGMQARRPRHRHGWCRR